MTIKEAKEAKQYTLTDCDDLAIKCRKATHDFLEAIKQQKGIDSETIKKAQSIAKWFIYVTPIETYIKNSKKKEKKLLDDTIGEEVMVSAKSGDDAVKTAIEAGKKQDVNVTVTESKTMKVKDLKHLFH